MARARWLKPEFFTDAKVCQVDDKAAMLFAAIWNEADDGGVAPGDPRDLFGRRFLKRERWGWTVEVVARCLADLDAVELAFPIVHRGERFVFIPEFARKQGIKPKLWRHLGPDHDAITAALMRQVLSKSNGGGERSNAGGTQENAGGLPSDPVSLPLTPKPLAVAISSSSSHKPQPFRSAAAQQAWNDLVEQVPEAHRDGIVGLVRSAGDPEAVVQTIRAAGPGGVNQATTSWEILGRAVLELRATGGGFSPLRLNAFCRKLEVSPRSTVPSTYGGSAFREAKLDD